MAILPMVDYNNPVLRQKAKRVSSIDGAIAQLIDDMVETMREVGGVGLAAPQVGVPLRIAVIELPDEEIIVLVNPKIVKRSGERQIEEGCLSIPGYRGEIQRSEKVTVKGLDRLGREIRIKGEGLLAQALEHELDHLDGTLYIDHLESIDKLMPVTVDVETREI
ncbi:MAG: peptide deformylase [Dehalococcoidia bacterium]|jgi:peptide deformylase|nr:peptide deformylase [Dehalococcoidia bacterium]